MFTYELYTYMVIRHHRHTDRQTENREIWTERWSAGS